MVLILNTDNAIDYLKQQGVCQSNQKLAERIKPREYKNFNLIIKLTENEDYLVKQERFDGKGNTSGDLKYEWVIDRLINNFTKLQPIKSLCSQVVHYDRDNSIIVMKYFADYLSLSQFYDRDRDYHPSIATAIGKSIARIHSLTFNNPKYREFLAHHADIRGSGKKPNFLRGLKQVGPGVFGNICHDGLEFFKLYQKYESLHQAVAELDDSYQACCLAHNDLRFSNFLFNKLQVDTESSLTEKSLKIIDWEFFNWGDPAYDLGVLIGKYLELWLDSLYVDSDTDLNLSLSLATCPLETIQLNLITLVKSYVATFPEIIVARPDFIKRAIQFAGLDLIKHIQHNIERHAPFDNGAICTLQVAKSLLCYPEKSMLNILGTTETELIK